MIKVCIFIAILFSSLFYFTGCVSAHELQTDGNIGAVLHIEPDDEPAANELQSFDLYFQSLTGKFNLYNCDCKLALSQDWQTIYQSPLNTKSSTLSENPYTFNKGGLYTLTVTGRPKNQPDFDSFKLEYNINTASGTGNMNKKLSPYTVIGLALLQLLVLLAFYDYIKP